MMLGSHEDTGILVELPIYIVATMSDVGSYPNPKPEILAAAEESQKLDPPYKPIVKSISR